jgi:hypothetical protein
MRAFLLRYRRYARQRIAYRQGWQRIGRSIDQHHNRHRRVRHVMMAFLTKRALETRFVLHVRNRSVERSLVPQILVARRITVVSNESRTVCTICFTSSETLRTPTTCALHFNGRSLIGQCRGVIVMSR